MRFSTIVVAGLGLVFLGTAAGLADDDGQERKVRAEQSYTEHCASCHGPGGMGDGPDAGQTRVPTLDLTTIAARRDGVFPKAEVTEIIDGRRYLRAHGAKGMPVWGKAFLPEVGGGGPAEVVVRDKIRLLVEHIEALQRQPEDSGADD